MDSENSTIENIFEKHQRFENKLEDDQEKFPLTHAFNKINNFSRKNFKKIMLGGAIVLAMGVGSFGTLAYHYGLEVQRINTEAQKFLSSSPTEIQQFIAQKRFQKPVSEDNIHIPFDENFNSDKEITIQSPFVEEQTIYFHTREHFKKNEKLDFYEHFERQTAIKMSDDSAFAYNSERYGLNIINDEYSKHYIIFDENISVDFTDYEDLKIAFVIFHEAAHTHFIQELNFSNPDFEKHDKQINESNSDLSALIATSKYFDLDYMTFQQTFSGLLSMRIKEAKENEKNGHNTVKALEYLLEIDEEEYNSLKKMSYTDIPYFANDLVLNLGLSDYRDFDKEDLLSEIKAYDSSSLDDESFNHLMFDIKQFVKNEMPDTNEEHNIQISQHIESFRALLSQKAFIDFIESEKAPESLKNSSDIKSMTEEFKKDHLEFSASLESFLQKFSDGIDVSFKDELEIPEVIQLATKEDNTDITELKKKYKIK
jgi:hypothetical protein